MSYIAFLDLLGTRESALIGTDSYSKRIKDFHFLMRETANCCKNGCRIYGYSDNAYIEIESLDDTIVFFQSLRKILMDNHMYFNAAIERGCLGINNDIIIQEDQKGNNKVSRYAMIFTSPEAIDVYLAQCHFYGIGISLSSLVCEDLIRNNKGDFCQKSLFQSDIKNDCYESVDDLSYEFVTLERLKYVISDYVSTAILNPKASRYYITPILSMIKSLDQRCFLDQSFEMTLNQLLLKTVPNEFSSYFKDSYIQLIVFSILDYVLSLEEENYTINTVKICSAIINLLSYQNTILETLPIVNSAIISNKHKHQILKILYSIESNSK